jgi:menaquinone-dependent protoporphyrinogen IX oxidase
MKTLIIYKSKTGNTKAYAEDIAKKIGGEVIPLKNFKASKAKDYDTIVFGGWVLGGTIQGLNKFLEHYNDFKDKNLIVFSVGLSVPTQEGRSILIEQNLLDMYHIRFYQLRGSFDMKKLHFPYNFMIRSSIKMMTANPDASTDVESLKSLKNNPVEVYDSEKIQKIVIVINSLSVIEAK